MADGIKAGDVYRTKPPSPPKRLRVVCVEPHRVGLRNVDTGRLSYRYTNRGEIPYLELESPLNLMVANWRTSGAGWGVEHMALLIESLIEERDILRRQRPTNDGSTRSRV